MSRTQDELEHQIEQQRVDLAHTVDALQAKLDVKAQAQRKAQEIRRHPAWVGGAVAAAVAIGVLLVWRRR